jgi:hypothetical protein
MNAPATGKLRFDSVHMREEDQRSEASAAAMGRLRGCLRAITSRLRPPKKCSLFNSRWRMGSLRSLRDGRTTPTRSSELRT